MTTATENRLQFLYLVASGNNDGVYKIGISVDPIKRLEQIKVQYDVPNAYILETMDVSSRDEVFAVEKALHDKYDRYRAHNYHGREWFRLSKAQIADIKNPREAQLMLLMATGGSMDDLSPEDLEIWEPLLDSFKDFCLSI